MNVQECSESKAVWWQVLLVGALLYFTGVAVYVSTGNPLLMPTMVLVGSLTVPVSFVTFFYCHRHRSSLGMPMVAFAFFYGGVIGAFAAALLEPLFVPRVREFSVLFIGLIEEFAKIIGVVLIVRGRERTSMYDGLILGAAAGMGFAALESVGYTFVSFLRSQGNIYVISQMVVTRGLLAPLGHGAWTAILAAVLVREKQKGRSTLSVPVLGAYLVVSVLHALWNGSQFLAEAVRLSPVLAFAPLLLIGAIGLVILNSLLKEARSPEPQPAEQPQAVDKAE